MIQPYAAYAGDKRRGIGAGKSPNDNEDGMATIGDVCRYLESVAPLELAEEWDNVGLLVGKASAPVARVMTCLTVTPESVHEAVVNQADLIVTHHPFPFRSLKKITDDHPVGRMLLELITNNVSVFSAHTAFDSACRGINQQLADALELSDVRPLIKTTELAPDRGSGRAGSLIAPRTLKFLADTLKVFLGVHQLRAVGAPEMVVDRVGIACGSAGQFMGDARRDGCQLFVTGETSFHTCLEAETTGIGLLLLGHFASERFAMETLAQRISDNYSDLRVWASRDERDPVRLV